MSPRQGSGRHHHHRHHHQEEEYGAHLSRDGSRIRNLDGTQTRVCGESEMGRLTCTEIQDQMTVMAHRVAASVHYKYSKNNHECQDYAQMHHMSLIIIIFHHRHYCYHHHHNRAIGIGNEGPILEI